MSLLPLFDDAPSFDRERLARSLREMAGQNVFIGTSSWKYEGWIGQIYSREHYMVRGKFSKKRFEEYCLREYAATFPVVCGDFSFYQFPTPEFWQKLFSAAPPTLQYAFKVPEEVTRKAFPTHPRYGPRAGEPNESYLNAEKFQAEFLAPLTPWRQNIPVLILEFGTFSKKSYADPAQFFRDLSDFLALLPSEWRFAVEIRNEDFLRPEYFATLRQHGAAHVFSSWTRMPPLYRQIEIADAFTTDLTVARGLLRTGRVYENAVDMFSPYERIQDPNPKTRMALRSLIERSRKKKQPAYLFINNRLEGNAPGTIDAILHEDDDADQEPVSQDGDDGVSRA